MGDRTNLSAELLRKSIAEVLAEVAFMCAEPAQTERGEGELLQSSVRFDGHCSGTLALVSTPAFARDVAANMMGLESDDERATRGAADAFGELANIVAGTILNGSLDAGASCELGIPDVRGVTAAEAARDPGHGAAVVALLVDERHQLAAIWKIDEPGQKS